MAKTEPRKNKNSKNLVTLAVGVQLRGQMGEKQKEKRERKKSMSGLSIWIMLTIMSVCQRLCKCYTATESTVN